MFGEGGVAQSIRGKEKLAAPACTPEVFQSTREESPWIFSKDIIMLKDTEAISIKAVFIHNVDAHSHVKVWSICVCVLAKWS